MPNPCFDSTLTSWLAHAPMPCLFLDIDGTLSPFEINPDHSRIPPATLRVLDQLHRSGIPMAIVTGRSLAEARRMLYPLELPIGATHGLEIVFRTSQQPDIPTYVTHELALMIQQIEHQINKQKLSNFLLEKKPYSVAFHYRQNPVLARVGQDIMHDVIKNFPHWQVKSGKFVWEAVPKGANKGDAVNKLLAHFNLNHPNSNPTPPYCPIFIGDDSSDEAGFRAVQAVNGIGIKVGQPLDYVTSAKFIVHDMREVSQFLQQILMRYHNVTPTERCV